MSPLYTDVSVDLVHRGIIYVLAELLPTYVNTETGPTATTFPPLLSGKKEPLSSVSCDMVIMYFSVD